MTPWVFPENPSEKKIEKIRYLDQFLTLGAAERLCVDTRDVVRAMRPKLVVILPFRTIFGGYLRLATPRRDIVPARL